MSGTRDHGHWIEDEFPPLVPKRRGAPRVLFSSQTPSHATPRAFYADLDTEFHFDFDPCPLNDASIWDGCAMSWVGKRVFCNPPYGRTIGRWLAKAREAIVAVYLLPSRTDTAWWHDYALKADEIRFVRGRLNFGDSDDQRQRAPFPSVVLVYRGGSLGPDASPSQESKNE